MAMLNNQRVDHIWEHEGPASSTIFHPFCTPLLQRPVAAGQWPRWDDRVETAAVFEPMGGIWSY